MGLLGKLLSVGVEAGISVIVKAPLETAWATMLSECVQAGYWVCESDQAARNFSYFVLETKFGIAGRSAPPGTPTDSTTPRSSSPSTASNASSKSPGKGPSFDFLQQ